MNAQLRPVEPRIGIFTDEPASVYHQRRLDEANASGLKQMLRSPAHFKHYAENPDDDKTSAALTFGRALHCSVLEPDCFDARYSVLPEYAPRRPTQAQWHAKKPSDASKEAMAWWTEWNDRNAGKENLSAADYERAQRMGESARLHPVARGLITGGQRETTFRWVDEATGIASKSRADLYAPGEFIMDLKSCRDASPDGFARAVTSYMYDVQQAHYVDGVRALGDSLRYFLFLAIESEAPYVCQPHKLDVRAEERGWNLRTKAITRQAECLRTGRWAGYSDGLNELSLPAYAYFQEENTP